MNVMMPTVDPPPSEELTYWRGAIIIIRLDSGKKTNWKLNVKGGGEEEEEEEKKGKPFLFFLL